MSSINRQQRLLKQGLPGSASFSTSELSDNDIISWDAATQKWIIDTIPAGVTDHGALTGLSDDDHPQYGQIATDETISGLWTHSDNIRITGGDNSTAAGTMAGWDMSYPVAFQCYMDARFIGGATLNYGKATYRSYDMDFICINDMLFSTAFGDLTLGGGTVFCPTNFTMNDAAAATMDLQNGAVFKIRDGTDADFAEFSHDGTDFNTDFTTTTDWNINDVDVRVENDLYATNLFADNLPVTKFKTGDTSRNNGGTGTTLTDDPDLAGWALEAGAWYSISGMLTVASATGPDLKMRMDFTNTPQDGDWAFITKRTTGSSSAYGNPLAAFDADISHNYAGTETLIWYVEGTFQANATTGGTLDFQWAQNTASATNVTFHAGSRLSVTKL